MHCSTVSRSNSDTHSIVQCFSSWCSCETLVLYFIYVCTELFLYYESRALLHLTHSGVDGLCDMCGIRWVHCDIISKSFSNAKAAHLHPEIDALAD